MDDASAVPPQGESNLLGVVGWEDDGGNAYDLGDSTNDGNSLIRVQLYKGRTPNKSLDQTRAQGAQLLCQLAAGLPIPAYGARVLVTVPGNVPGMAVITSVLTNNWQALGNTGAGELVIQIPGSPAQIVIRKNGTIVLKTTDAGGNDVVLSFGPTGLTYSSQWVTVAWDFNGIRQTHVPTGAGLFITATAPLPAPFAGLASVARLSGGICKVDGTLVLLGPDLPGGAQVWQPAAWGPDPGPGPLLVTGVKSTSVKIAP
jgi:hypothetical protein